MPQGSKMRSRMKSSKRCPLARSMDVYITKLRKYFKDEPNVDIQNVHGVGFKLVVK